MFSGNADLFREALESGEVQEGVDGKFYYGEFTKAHEEVKGSTIKGSKVSDVDEKDLNKVFMELIKDKPDIKEEWLRCSAKKIPKKLVDETASDNDMMVLQESYDSVTRVTSAIRKVAMELIKSGASSTSSELANKGVKLCKLIVPSQEAVEELLYTEKSRVSAVAVREALQAAAGPYKELIVYYNELVAVHRHVVSSSSSGSGSRFKAIAA